ncbi:MAG: lytic murein transglycosylase [Desulfovibrionaceae bacterium]|nr:lytic murein transglycosylase [Desulfovibrionaceae bacterium]
MYSCVRSTLALLCLAVCLCGMCGEVWAANAWDYLIQRLHKDGVQGAEVDALLGLLPATPTQSPMGRKILALYKKQFFPQPKIKPTDYYKGVVSNENVQKCKAYLLTHEAALTKAETVYGVPKALIVALLFVETRLGEVLGDVPENAFYTLASMAQARTPEAISAWLPKMKGYKKRLKWITKNMVDRSNWAYKEFRALVKYMLQNGIKPEELPCSIYGAIGLCQFMPSNILPYAADGDQDGRIDLFKPADAFMSVGKYMVGHGWKPNLSWQEQHTVLMRYNHSKVYANTILALSALITAQ